MFTNCSIDNSLVKRFMVEVGQCGPLYKAFTPHLFKLRVFSNIKFQAGDFNGSNKISRLGDYDFLSYYSFYVMLDLKED